MSGRRALITGIDGFTGQYLSAELSAAGYRVSGIARQGTASAELEVVDLLDRQGMREAISRVQPDLVAHLAGIAFVAHGDAEEIYRVNVVGTRNLLEALAELSAKPSCVLLASSANVYGNTEVDAIDESIPPAPSSDYAVSKLAMEYLARLWADRLPIVVTRPFNYTGVGQGTSFVVPKIVSHFRAGSREIELGNIAVSRDFSDVRWVARVYRCLLERCPAGETFNLCSGTGRSLSEILATMSAIAGYPIDVKVNPAFVRANEVRRLVGTAEKLHRVIGPMPPVPIEDTLRWMYEA